MFRDLKNACFTPNMQKSSFLQHANPSLFLVVDDPIIHRALRKIATILFRCPDVQTLSTCFKRLEINNSEERGDEPRCAQPPDHVRHYSLEQRRRQNSTQTERGFSCTVRYQRGVLDTRDAHRVTIPVGTTFRNNRQETKFTNGVKTKWANNTHVVLYFLFHF